LYAGNLDVQNKHVLLASGEFDDEADPFVDEMAGNNIFGTIRKNNYIYAANYKCGRTR
jgi:hypothetical protein